MTGQIASIVAFIGMVLAMLGITGVDSVMLTGLVNGVISAVTIGAAILSWWQHRKAAQ